MFVKKLIKKNIFTKTKSYSKNVVIVNALRTAIGSFNGKLSSFEAPKLGALVIRQLIDTSGISKTDVEEVIMGNVCSSGLGQHPARQSVIHSGLPVSTIATTLNKMCASGIFFIYLLKE
jgi:acetyl-CoA C-acetyltransferase